MCFHILDAVKDERIISPKIEKLSIKNFVTVNPPKPISGQPAFGSLQANDIQDGGQKNTPSRRVDFVTIQPTRETQPDVQHLINSSPSIVSTSAVTTPVAMAISSTTTQPRRVNFTTLQSAKNSTNKLTLPPSPTEQQNPDKTSSVQQTRRVGFVTLKPGQTTCDTSPKTTSSHTQDANSATANTLPTGEQNNDTTISPQQPRRVGFVTLTSPQGSRSSQQVLPNNFRPTTNQIASVRSDEGEGGTPNTQPPPRRVAFVTLKPPQSSSDVLTDPTSTNNSSRNATISSEDGQGCTLNSQPSPPNANTVTVEERKITQMSATSNANQSTNNTSFVATVRNTLSRQERPPIPLEPTVIILND